jgi:hypothetical protein
MIYRLLLSIVDHFVSFDRSILVLVPSMVHCSCGHFVDYSRMMEHMFLCGQSMSNVTIMVYLFMITIAADVPCINRAIFAQIIISGAYVNVDSS